MTFPSKNRLSQSVLDAQLYVYIYIEIEREREREKEINKERIGCFIAALLNNTMTYGYIIAMA